MSMYVNGKQVMNQFDLYGEYGRYSGSYYPNGRAYGSAKMTHIFTAPSTTTSVRIVGEYGWMDGFSCVFDSTWEGVSVAFY